MNFADKIKKLIHKIYRHDDFIADYLISCDSLFDEIETVITRLTNLLHFNRLDVKGCQWWENLLAIENISQNLEDRQAKIRAKWIATVHNDIELIQKVCDSWKRGEVEVDFVGGKIQIKFVSTYGIPDDLQNLLKSIEEVKPAHLAYVLLYKYLLIKDIHEVKTISQMGTLTLNMFASGREDI